MQICGTIPSDEWSPKHQDALRTHINSDLRFVRFISLNTHLFLLLRSLRPVPRAEGLGSLWCP